MRLSGKTCVVTGAASGIGRACCELFCAEGARVIAVDRDAEGAAALDEAIRLRGGAVEVELLDLSERRAIERFWQAVGERHRRIDGLVNVVGISGRRLGDGPLHECTDEAFETLMTINVRSAFQMSRGALRLMLEAGGGSIVNVASVLAFAPSPKHFATHLYAASKGALIAMTVSAAAYYAPYRIRLNALAPGLVRTPMSERAAGDPETLAYLRDKQPLTGTLGSPEDVAAAALYLISDESRFVTGVVLPVDGGWSVCG